LSSIHKTNLPIFVQNIYQAKVSVTSESSVFPLFSCNTRPVSFAVLNDVLVVESGLQWAVTCTFVFVLQIMPLLLNVFQIYYISINTYCLVITRK